MGIEERELVFNDTTNLKKAVREIIDRKLDFRIVFHPNPFDYNENDILLSVECSWNYYHELRNKYVD